MIISPIGIKFVDPAIRLLKNKSQEILSPLSSFKNSSKSHNSEVKPLGALREEFLKLLGANQKTRLATPEGLSFPAFMEIEGNSSNEIEIISTGSNSAKAEESSSSAIQFSSSQTMRKSADLKKITMKEVLSAENLQSLIAKTIEPEAKSFNKIKKANFLSLYRSDSIQDKIERNQIKLSVGRSICGIFSESPKSRCEKIIV